MVWGGSSTRVYLFEGAEGSRSGKLVGIEAPVWDSYGWTTVKEKIREMQKILGFDSDEESESESEADDNDDEVVPKSTSPSGDLEDKGEGSSQIPDRFGNSSIVCSETTSMTVGEGERVAKQKGGDGDNLENGDGRKYKRQRH